MLLSLARRPANLALGVAAYIFTVLPAQAQIFGEKPSIEGGEVEDFRTALLNILNTILSFLALLAVIFIVVAGVRLIISQGEEQEKDKARKGIIYVIMGLVVVLFAKAIVAFVETNIGTGGT